MLLDMVSCIFLQSLAIAHVFKQLRCLKCTQLNFTIMQVVYRAGLPKEQKSAHFPVCQCQGYNGWAARDKGMITNCV